MRPHGGGVVFLCISNWFVVVLFVGASFSFGHIPPVEVSRFTRKFTQKFVFSRCNPSNFLKQKWVEPVRSCFFPKEFGLSRLNSTFFHGPKLP